MHDLYRRQSLCRVRPIRRLRYGRGFGVHSPFAYRLICQVVRPRSDYYLPPPEDDTLGLWYRMIARLAPDFVSYGETTEGRSQAIDYGSMADSRVEEMPLSEVADRTHGLLYTDSIEDARHFLEVDGRGVLLRDIRRSRAAEQSFYSLVDQLPRGIILDLYDEALLFSKNNDLYTYRSSL